jgi:Tfp pilus assembly protein PilX
MRMTHTTGHARSERGFSMFLVIMAMFLTSMFVAAGFAAANGDLHLSGDSRDRKIAYAAAEAGLNFYEAHLTQDSDYWTHCSNVPKPDVTKPDPSPVNPVWDPASKPTDPRNWRNVTKSAGQYTIEILPAAGNGNNPKTGKPYTDCVEGDQNSVLEQKTGTFRIRVTGRPSATSPLHRSIIATFKRKGFLDYLWFTYYEDLDPAAMSTQSQRDNFNTYCLGKFRWQRPSGPAPVPANACTEIQWITGDGVAGPVHSNDSLLICNQPTFGRASTGDDKIEVMPPTNGLVAASGCTQSAKIQGIWKPGADRIEPPADDQDLEGIAKTGGSLFTGRTIIYLQDDKMTVRLADGTLKPNIALPANGVIYVKGATAADGAIGTPACVTQYPVDIDYTDKPACGNVYVSGTYSKNLTIAADNDVIVAPTSGGNLNTTTVSGESIRQVDGSDAVLGLIANHFVRVAHQVNRGSSCTNVASNWKGADVRVDAAVLALQHSWVVDNWNCGEPSGKLTLFGAIAQYYRGPVGTGGHATGFLKDYQYDDRLKYRSPPYFLSPLAAQWAPVRLNEQVPAR